jgi:peptidase E
MHLILSSCDFGSPAVCAAIMKELPRAAEECTVLYFPSDKASNKDVKSSKFKKRLEGYGFTRANVTVFNKNAPEKYFGADYDVVYVGGGNTFAMLKTMRDTGFDSEIIRCVRNGALYIGGSAGAHIASRDVEHVEAFDVNEAGLSDYSGLGLFDGIFICHYCEERRPYYEKALEENRFRVFTLADDEYITLNE